MIEHLPRQQVQQHHPRQVQQPTHHHHHAVRRQRPHVPRRAEIRREHMEHRRQHERIHRRRPQFGLNIRLRIQWRETDRIEVPKFKRPQVLGHITASAPQIARQLPRIHRLRVVQPVELRPRVEQDHQQRHQRKHPHPKRPQLRRQVNLDNPILHPLKERPIRHGFLRLLSRDKRHDYARSLSHAIPPFQDIAPPRPPLKIGGPRSVVAV